MKKQSLAWILALALVLSSSVATLASGEQYLLKDKDQALADAVDSLMTAVFTAEYGDGSSDFMVRWGSPLKVFVSGAYTGDDLAATQRFIRDLNERVTWLPDVSMADSAESANVTITFAKLDELAALNNPGYTAGDWGSFTYWFEDFLINRAEIIIASDVTTQDERNYLILMRLTNALGLTRRITNFTNSIISDGWTVLQQLSGLDWLMLNLLYEPWLYPGISSEETRTLLTGGEAAAALPEIIPAEESISDTALKSPLELTLQELAIYNGKDGQPAYIAVGGIIYDVTGISSWAYGQHKGFEAGNDLTEAFANSPHDVSKLSEAVEVGLLVTK